MVWGCICRQGRPLLIIVYRTSTGQCYVDDILRLIVLPFLQQQPRGVIHQHDNARLPYIGIIWWGTCSPTHTFGIGGGGGRLSYVSPPPPPIKYVYNPIVPPHTHTHDAHAPIEAEPYKTRL